MTNRAYLETRQDDGFRQVAAQEFTDIYVLDLGSDVRRNPKIIRHHPQEPTRQGEGSSAPGKARMDWRLPAG